MTVVKPLADLEGTPHANVFPEKDPKTIRLTLASGDEVAPHSHPDREIVFYLIEGSIELLLDDDRYELTASDVAWFDGDQEISPRAIQDSTALIVLARRDAH